MTSKCNKVKNPCKICLAPVTRKTGLQCQGACRNWVHYNCLNFTPGKIKDIKTGVITITCPCPDCKSEYPKEIRTDEPYSCTNINCPANRPPNCGNDNCPSNQKMNQTSGIRIDNMTGLRMDNIAGLRMDNIAGLRMDNVPGLRMDNKTGSIPLANCERNTCKNHKVFQPQCVQTGGTPTSSSGALVGRHMLPLSASSDAGDMQRNMMPSLSAVEQMCNTVGQLTNQINDLMCKMKQVVKEKNAQGGCSPRPRARTCEQQGPKAQCPKPCCCAQTPHR